MSHVPHTRKVLLKIVAIAPDDYGDKGKVLLKEQHVIWLLSVCKRQCAYSTQSS